MSTLKSSAENLTLNADGSGNDIILQSNGSTVGTLTAEGVLTIGGTTPTLTIGDAGAEDTKIVFDGNAQDYYIGLDDTDDDFKIGLGSTLGTTAHIVIDETGAVTKPLQPAFLVVPSGYQSNIAADSSDVTIILNSEIFDQNADFNTGTYTFTAPVTGRYQLNLTVMVENLDSASDYWLMKIITSNRSYHMYQDLRGLSADAAQWTWTLPVLADMDSGDTAYCTLRQYDGTAQTDIFVVTNFSGYLVA